LGIGDWDWGLGPIPNPQSPIPNPQSPIIRIIILFNYFLLFFIYLKILYKNLNNKNLLFNKIYFI